MAETEGGDAVGEQFVSVGGRRLKVTCYAKKKYFLHNHVSPLWKETLKVSGKKILSLFVLIHSCKNLSENELIRFWPLYDVITIFWVV